MILPEPAGTDRSPDDWTTVEQACRAVTAQLQAAGVATPALDARILVCAATGLTREQLILDPGRPLQADDRRRLDDFATRRMAREPVARILGEREFWGRSFCVTPATLDPRPDSETVVETVVTWLRTAGGRRPCVVDLGTGTGCLLVSILGEISRAWGIGIDIDPAAVATAQANTRRHIGPGRAAFLCGDWLDPLDGRFTVIVANPPYIRTGDIDRLSPEVAGYDPRGALDGGEDGLDPYRQICEKAFRCMEPGGLLAVEIGDGREQEVAKIIVDCGLEIVQTRPDLAGRARCICATPLS